MSDQIVPLPTAPRKKGGKKKEEVQAKLHLFQGSKMEQLKQLFDQWWDCKRCMLHEYRRLDTTGAYFPDIVFAEGNPDAHIMIVGEGPGEEEVTQGVPFYGLSGRLLNQMLARVSDDTGIQELYRWYQSGRVRQNSENRDEFRDKMLKYRHAEYFITNAVSCRPPDNRTPTKLEVQACWERLYNIIHIVDPWLIIASGKTALEAVLRKKHEILKVEGKVFEATIPGVVGDVKYPVIATLHPSYLLRVADFDKKDGAYAKTIQSLMRAHQIVDQMRYENLGTPIPHRVPLNL